MAKAYDNRFFDWVDQTAARSARLMLPIVRDLVGPSSVVDVGCGRGTWLAQWRALGAGEIKGLDGDYVDRARLAISQGEFEAVDLKAHFAPTRRYDLAQSLEVAEHLPPGCGPGLVSLLCALSDVVLFSAAVPGQGGEDHLNERPVSYWAELFEAKGYTAFDAVRPAVRDLAGIEPWYRFNSVLYANAAGEQRLARVARAAKVEDLTRLDGAGDVLWKLRCSLLRPLPVDLVTRLSRLRYSLATAWPGAADPVRT